MRVFRRISMLALLLTAGCAKRDPSTLFAPDAGTIVVDAFLVVGSPFPRITLTQTLAANVQYSLWNAALAGASVQVASARGTVYYGELNEQPGLYEPVSGALEPIQPGLDYALDIRTADGRHVQATTRTPAAFSVRDWLLLDDTGTSVAETLATFADYGYTVFTRPENQLIYTQGLLEARFDPAGITGIQVGLFSLSPNSPLLIDPDRVGEENLGRINSSPPFEAREGKVRLPWFAIFYEGNYILKIWTMDANWFDLARTDPVLRGGGFGFGGQAGDSFERPIFHLEGAIGLFGSGSVDSVGVVVHPRP
jgi:hypothetical protein